jgi:membrane-bound lytic murein transglycosylase D
MTNLIASIKPLKILKGLFQIIIIRMMTVTLSSCDRQEDTYLSDSKDKTVRKSGKAYRNGGLWKRVRNNFDITPKSSQNKKIQHYVKQYRGDEERLNKASPYLYYIVEQIEKRDLPGELALLPMIESAFEPGATSHKGAAGLWQFMPSTGRSYGLKQDKHYDGRRDITASTDAALSYLAMLHKKFDKNWMLALAAYNAGEGTIQKAINRNKKKGKSTNFWDLDLPRETKEYVPKLLALAEVVKTNRLSELPAVANEPYFVRVNPGEVLDFNKVAKLADIEVKELKRLNPGYRKNSTHPSGPQQLLLPVENAETFLSNHEKK